MTASPTPVESATTTRIAFLDDDHVLRMVRGLLTARTDRDWVGLAEFFWPDVADPEALRALRVGLELQDGVVIGDRPEGANVLVTRRGRVDRRLLDANPGLRLIQRLGSRTDGLDLATAGERGIEVSCLPRLSLVRTAEHALLLMLALVKRLTKADRAVRAGCSLPSRHVAYNWAGLAGLGGLHGRTLGILGFGEVGRLVAERARAFGMKVLYATRTRLPPHQEAAAGVVYRTKADLLAQADIVSLHLPGTVSREPVLGRAEFDAMRAGALLVNTSRGWLLDEDALFDALKTGHLGGAGLDVHRTEPRAPGDPLCTLDNVVLTPHIAGGSRLAVLDEVGQMFDNIHSVLAGGAPIHGRVVSGP